jgi:hypothetical protein
MTEKEYRALDKVSQSDLNRYVEYSMWGERRTNLLAFKYPVPFETSDVMTIGTIVDEYFTEGKKRERVDNTFGEYTIVSRRSGKELELNETMVSEIESKIKMLSIPEFLAVFDNSEKQLILTAEAELALPIKGKLDMYVAESCVIVDLKTSGKTIADFEKDFLFKGIPSVYHRYVRQLAFYRLLCRANNRDVSACQIMFAGSNGIKAYEIPNKLLDQAEAMIAFDIQDLKNALEENRVVTTFEVQEEATDEETNNITF